MKRTIFNFVFVGALAFAGSATISSCGSKSQDEAHEETEQTEGTEHEHESEAHEHETEETETEAIAYACPMHPEETGKEGDTCPKCKMALEKVEKETEE